MDTKDIPLKEQLSEHFQLWEFFSTDKGDKDGLSWFAGSPVTYTARLKKLCVALEKVRLFYNTGVWALPGGQERSVTINSGIRSPWWNKQVGGAPDSQHLHAEAADFTVSGVDPLEVSKHCEGMEEFGGVGTYATWTHADIRDRGSDEVQARWNG